MQIIVHAGLHKTGTTSFQTQVYHSTQDLMSKGIYYPAPIDRAGIIGQHSQVALLLMAGERKRVSEYLEKVATDAEHYRWHTVLMSGEEFSSLYADSATFEFLTDELRRLFGNWEYVIAVRNLASHTSSQLMQDVYEGRSALANRAVLREVAEARIFRTVDQVAFFANRTDSRLIDYAGLVKSGNLCLALLDDLIGTSTVNLEDLRDNTFEGKVTTAANFALATVRGAVSVAFPDDVSAKFAELVEVDKFNAAFNADALDNLASGLKAGVASVCAQAVDDNLASIQKLLEPHPDALRMLGVARSNQSETSQTLADPQAAGPVAST